VPGEAEVGDLHRPVRRQKDVAGLEVAVDDAGAVRRVHGVRERGRDGRGVSRGLGHAREFLRQRPAVDELHREVRPPVELADVVHLDDVRVSQRRDCFGFPREPHHLGAARVRAREEHLDRHQPI
jgi:hypothetical protein